MLAGGRNSSQPAPAHVSHLNTDAPRRAVDVGSLPAGVTASASAPRALHHTGQAAKSLLYAVRLPRIYPAGRIREPVRCEEGFRVTLPCTKTAPVKPEAGL
jgi:hypothetical protein